MGHKYEYQAVVIIPPKVVRIFWPRGGLIFGPSTNIPHAPRNRAAYSSSDSSEKERSNESIHGEALTVSLVVASLQRSSPSWDKKREHKSKTLSDPYRKRLRKPWKFLITFVFLFSRPLHKKMLRLILMRVDFRASHFGHIGLFKQTQKSFVKIEAGLLCKIGSGDGARAT